MPVLPVGFFNCKERVHVKALGPEGILSDQPKVKGS